MIKYIALLCCLLIGCSVTVSAAAHPAEEGAMIVIDLLMGEPIPMEVLLDDLAQVRVVFLGEVHTVARHHRFQTEVLKGLVERGSKLALGMEMFTEDQQPILDRWQRGTEDLGSIVKELGPDFWTNQQDYEALMTTARKLGVPIVGLNASSKLVRKVARNGLHGLNSLERKALPFRPDQINPLYDHLLRLRLRVHKAFQARDLQPIVQAQVLRDETMAQAVVRFLESPEGKDRVMLVIAGNGHVNYGFGIPEGVRRRLDIPLRIIVSAESGELVLTEAEKRQSVPIHITHEELRFIRVPIGDYLQLIPLKKEDE